MCTFLLASVLLYLAHEKVIRVSQEGRDLGLSSSPSEEGHENDDPTIKPLSYKGNKRRAGTDTIDGVKVELKQGSLLYDDMRSEALHSVPAQVLQQQSTKALSTKDSSQTYPPIVFFVVTGGAFHDSRAKAVKVRARTSTHILVRPPEGSTNDLLWYAVV